MTKTSPSDFRLQTSDFILVKDSSKDFDTQAKTGWKPNGFPSLGQHPEEERILVRIFFKDYSEIDYFLRQQHLNKDFLQRFLA